MPEFDCDSARGKHIQWHERFDEASWIDAAVGAIGTALRNELDHHDETWLLLSGGSTPAPVYRALAEQALDWSRVVVSLVDERDVDEDSAASNARLIRETLLRRRAVEARFLPLREDGQSICDATSASNFRWPLPGGEAARSARGASIAIAVLGMGEDGHTASLFPGAANLDAALVSALPYAAIDARGCAAAGDWPHRTSLTPAGLAQANRRLLLIRGAAKRGVFGRALEAGAVRNAPIRAAIDVAGTPLHVEWGA